MMLLINGCIILFLIKKRKIDASFYLKFVFLPCFLLVREYSLGILENVYRLSFNYTLSCFASCLVLIGRTRFVVVHEDFVHNLCFSTIEIFSSLKFLADMG
jgi:hypothetical protein